MWYHKLRGETMGVFGFLKKKIEDLVTITWTTPAGTRYDLYTDMLKEPHLILCGAAGSGKSYMLNGILCTALFDPPGYAEDRVQFILIDPLRVELCDYEHLPHTIAYATEPHEYLDALQIGIDELESRYSKARKEGLKEWKNDGNLYIVIDDFHSVMLSQKNYIMPFLSKILSLGHLVCVHLILLTKTANKNVLPDEFLINASKVALHCQNERESEYFLGVIGAEKLPYRGELYYQDYSGKIERWLVPDISQEQVGERIGWWMNQNSGKYNAKRKPPERPVPSMTGYQFEEYVAGKLSRAGYKNVRVTSKSGDYGADVLAYSKGKKVCVQCKKYSKPVGIKAVQEVVGAMSYYGCSVGIVVSTVGYTSAARNLANASGVVLMDVDKIRTV